mgnify:CR=1 FL=1
MAPSASSDVRWRVRLAKRVLTDDIPQVGHDAYERAKKAILKKLPVAPEQYGEPLPSPLHGLYKLKSSDARVVYHVEVESHEVWVLLIGDRATIWDDREADILERLAGERQEAIARRPDHTLSGKRRRRR